MVLSLKRSNELLRLMSDSSRVRLLALLEERELSVAELTEILRMAQSRVSTHLGKLREAGLVRVHRAGTTSYCGLNEAEMTEEVLRLWRLVRETTRDPVFEGDAARAEQVVAAREGGGSWADSVAGNMERHYSPGRTCEATLRAVLGLIRLGRVVDIGSGDGVIAELLSPMAAGVTCVDISERVVNAGRKRLEGLDNVGFVVGDMHALPFDPGAFDTALIMNALTYSNEVARVLGEAARVLAPGGKLIATTLRRHRHHEAVAKFNHANLGFEVEELRTLLGEAGFRVRLCEVTGRERRAPHFETITIHAETLGEDR